MLDDTADGINISRIVINGSLNKKGAFEMAKILGGKMVPVALALAGGLWISSCAASQAADADADTARPGSFQAIMAVKAPQVYGPHLAQADAPIADHGAQPKPGSFQAIMSAKAPEAFGPHLAAADAAPAKVANSTCRAGSFAAIMSAKLPPSARPGNAEMYRDCR